MFSSATLPLPGTASHAEAPGAIKLLDLLTNRYHSGIVRETSAAELQVEVPASSHFHAGQRVRFVVAGKQQLISKNAMRRAFITNVSAHPTDRMNVQLALVPEAALA